MPSVESLRRGAAILALALPLAGCAPGLMELRADPELSHAALREGKLAVLPVTASDRSVDASALEIVRAGLLRQIAAERPGLPLVDIDAQLLAGGGASPARFAAAYWSAGGAPAGPSGQLARELGARFLVLTNIDEDSVSRSESSGSPDPNTVRAERFTTRSVALRMAIFDAQVGAPRWEARHSGLGQESRKAEAAHGGPVTALLDKATGYTQVDYPEATPLYKVTDDILGAMVARWPEP
ncbi:MAG: hypothetical protein IT372_34995 [Polyangiaceae bacterium]|nr:hypothetical protein [Polyangiaceae bacterium]